MPKKEQFSKEDVIKAAFNIVKEEGFEGLNARKIAQRLNSSVHPIFNHFKSMKELKKAIYQKMTDIYHEYMLSGIDKEKAYKQIGLSYIKFAKDYPEFFKIMFMEKTNLNAENFMMADSISDEIIKAGQKMTGFSYEEQRIFHIKVWIFTHGIASLVATGTVDFTDDEIEELLTASVREMVIGKKFEKGKKNE